MFLSFSVIFPSYTDKCLVLMNTIIIPLTSVFYFVFSSYTSKCLVIRISGIVIPKSLIHLIVNINFKFQLLSILKIKNENQSEEKLNQPVKKTETKFNDSEIIQDKQDVPKTFYKLKNLPLTDTDRIDSISDINDQKKIKIYEEDDNFSQVSSLKKTSSNNTIEKDVQDYSLYTTKNKKMEKQLLVKVIKISNLTSNFKN